MNNLKLIKSIALIIFNRSNTKTKLHEPMWIVKGLLFYNVRNEGKVTATGTKTTGTLEIKIMMVFMMSFLKYMLLHKTKIWLASLFRMANIVAKNHSIQHQRA